MREGPPSAQRITYRALISACEKDRDPERALTPFETMQTQGLKPNLITYLGLISACEKGRVIAYSALISACEKGRLQRVREGGAPASFALISACEKGHIQGAWSLHTTPCGTTSACDWGHRHVTQDGPS